MPVSYTKEQKERAKQEGLHLVTISATGMEFQGPTTEEERDGLLEYILAFLERRRGGRAATSPKLHTPEPPAA